MRTDRLRIFFGEGGTTGDDCHPLDGEHFAYGIIEPFKLHIAGHVRRQQGWLQFTLLYRRARGWLTMVESLRGLPDTSKKALHLCLKRIKDAKNENELRRLTEELQRIVFSRQYQNAENQEAAALLPEASRGPLS